MKRDYLGKVLGIAAIISFIGVFITVMLQVLTRFLPVSFSWTEELSRLLFVASICFAAPIAYRDLEFVIVDILIDRMPSPIRKIVTLMIHIAIIILFVMVLKHGIAFAINGHRQMSSTLKFPMSYPFGLIPLSAAC